LNRGGRSGSFAVISGNARKELYSLEGLSSDHLDRVKEAIFDILQKYPPAKCIGPFCRDRGLGLKPERALKGPSSWKEVPLQCGPARISSLRLAAKPKCFQEVQAGLKLLKNEGFIRPDLLDPPYEGAGLPDS